MSMSLFRLDASIRTQGCPQARCPSASWMTTNAARGPSPLGAAR